MKFIENLGNLELKIITLILLLLIFVVITGMLIYNFSDELSSVAGLISFFVFCIAIDAFFILDTLKENKNYKIEQEMIAEEKEKEKETVKKINEIFKSNKTILRIELTVETEDMVERRIRGSNYEIIEQSDDGKRLVLVKPLEFRFIKKEQFEKELKTSIYDENFWKKQREREFETNEFSLRYYENKEVIYKQFIYGKLSYIAPDNKRDKFELIEQYTAFENTSKDFDTIQIVIENTENLDFKNEIDSTQLQNELKKWNYYLVKEEKVENEYIYTFSNTKEIRDEKQPNFMIKQK